MTYLLHFCQAVGIQRTHSTPVTDSEFPTPEQASRQSAIGQRILSRGGTNCQYTVRLAKSAEDLHSAQALRFIVFNLELDEGLESSFLTLRDEDPYDSGCDHLLVESAGEIVGTYRMQTGTKAMKNCIRLLRIIAFCACTASLCFIIFAGYGSQ